MKLLGRTQDGEPIIQMSNAEWGAFCALGDALEGKVLDFFPDHDRRNMTAELSQAIEGVRMYVTSLDVVNQMQEHLDDMREALQGESE